MGRRDATMILVAYRHGLRASELCSLRWDQVDLERGLVHVRRLKNGTPSVHPTGGTEKFALVKPISDPNFPLTAYSAEHCASDVLALRLARCGQGQIEAHL
jgi:type 1 fimbriae regulatory protein FimB/type 1 fimbriae regulatory protein FimE